MFNLDRHIEILLLKHDCVVVPGFGGFVAHHIAAHLDERDGMMLPPMTVVGFNQQLTLNDSLLIQTYEETYDMSYPEAQRQIEQEVEEMKSAIANNGYFDIRSIGRVSLNSQGKYEFKPCESGILTPRLFGLSGIDTNDTHSFLSLSDKRFDGMCDREQEENADNFIRISTRAIRNAAVACAILALLITIPYSKGNINTSQLLSSIDTSFIRMFMPTATVKQEVTPETKPVVHVYVKKKKAPVTPVVIEENKKDTIIAEFPHEETAKEPVSIYTVVLAARIAKENAEEYASALKSKGIKAKVIGEGKSRKVVCGEFANETDAQNLKRQLSEQEEFASAWVTSVKI